MVKATELRIRNYVGYTNQHIQVESINNEGINEEYPVDNPCADMRPIAIPYTDVQPIPLTPEILKEAGFERNDSEFNVWFTRTDRFAFHIDLHNSKMAIHDPNFRKYAVSDLARGMQGLPVPSALHQLQNLYYALTGIELKVSLTEKVNV